ncbi:hypothetical protein RMCBS344292_10300 [Rhizopus microsporus]|nr:hypothetical protein RMCBS344292_10300 [Rhizopus microsporus]
MNLQNSPNFVLPSYSTQRKRSSLCDLASDFMDSHLLEANNDSLWTDLYAPEHENDLAIRSARIKEVRMAINNSSIGKQKGPVKILMLTGPSGCGKSTLIRLISKTDGYKLIEWLPSRWAYDDNRAYNTQHSNSPMERFRQFLHQSIHQSTFDEQYNKKIILVDDMPDLTTNSVKNQFHSILQTCLNSPVPFLIVFIVSDVWLSTESIQKSYDTRLVSIRDLIPPELSIDQRLQTIEFLPITKPAIIKVLSKTALKANVQIGKDRLDELSELSNGDIRAAINMLQFYSTSKNTDKHSGIKRKRDDDASLFCRTTGSLSLFHAVGKVLYAKRDINGYYESKPEDILGRLPVDNDLFISYLHENCPMFLDGSEACAEALESLCEADLIRSKDDWQNDILSACRCLVSMHGIMITRKEKVGGNLRPLNKPSFFEVQYRAEANKNKELDLKIASLCNANKDTSESQTINQDPIQDFSEDEFDTIYGDGTELMELLDGF